MDSFMHPLEHNVYSWLVANHSRTTNTSFYPFFSSSSGNQDHLETKSEVEQEYLNVTFENLSLGFLSFLVLQKKFKSLDGLPMHSRYVSGKWNGKIYDLILTNILKTVVGLALMAVSLPIILPTVCLFWFLSQIIKTVYTIQFNNTVSKAEGMDGLWGLETKESRPFILICLLLSGKPDMKKIRRHICTKILNVKDKTGDYKYKKFRQTFSKLYGYYMWRDVNILDVEQHIRLIDLQKLYHTETEKINGSEVNVPEEESVKAADDLLHRFLSEEGATELSDKRPPWEVLVLLRGDGSYNVVIRLHHAIGDGISMMRLCVETLVDTPLPTPKVGPSMNNAFLRAAMMIWSVMILPFGLLRLVGNFDRNAMHGCPLSGKKVIATSRGLPLPVLKSIKIASGTTVNDVLMSCLSASVSKHFARRNEDIEQVTAIIPVSFHDLKAPFALTNQFSCATVKLSASQSMVPSERLKKTKRLCDGMKRDPTLLAVYSLMRSVSEVLPASVAELILAGSGLTLAASNVPGPQQEITIWEDRVRGIQFWVPNRAPVGVGFSFASYMGVVKVGLNVDAALVDSREEAQQLLDDIEAEVYALHRQFVRQNVDPHGVV